MTLSSRTDTVTLSVIDELIKNLANVPVELRKSVAKTGMATALEHLKQAIESRAPVGETGNLADSISKESPRTYPRSLWGAVYTNPRRAPHAQLVEFGHRMVIDGEEKGMVPPHPFMRPAFESLAPTLLKEITDAVRNALLKKQMARIRKEIRARKRAMRG
jgi:HK97 gp10 family phage protein